MSFYRRLLLRLKLSRWFPSSKIAWTAVYVLALDLFLFVLQSIFAALKLPYGQSLDGWVSFLSFVAILLFVILAVRWVKKKLLWRLRNRLIVTYVFIGVIPVVLLVALAAGSFYLFAGQFATFVVTSGLNSELMSLDSNNSTIAHELAERLVVDGGSRMPELKGLRTGHESWSGRQICVWVNGKLVLNSVPPGTTDRPPVVPTHVKDSFHGVVRDGEKLYLRSLETVPAGKDRLTVLSSEPFDQQLLQRLSTDLGEITLYAAGIQLRQVKVGYDPSVSAPESAAASNGSAATKLGGQVASSGRPAVKIYKLDPGSEPLTASYTAGTVPPSTGAFDRLVNFPTSIFAVDWATGSSDNPAAISVQTRVSKLYERLFAALGEFAPAVELSLLVVAVIFGLIELVALWVGGHLTRTVTGAVAQLYLATQHINKRDFSHRIPVKSNDQLASLANSFNSMTASIEELVEEQKQKQRLENELAIAQEVQAQLFPRKIAQLQSLEVHGFCRPARTVSGDYYDFLCRDPNQMTIAVGDVSGKGISAALLMATINSAVRAYSVEGVSVMPQMLEMSGRRGGIPSDGYLSAAEVSPGALLALLNHQLYETTPPEKYATLFLAIYDGDARRLTYSNGGHLAPIILAADGEARRLEAGGTVVGLFDEMTYDEDSSPLRQGEIFIAYSDGVTEPENDFGEFGEERLINLVRENRNQSLARISEIVTEAVTDWIGETEQPDDITLVLARGR